MDILNKNNKNLELFSGVEFVFVMFFTGIYFAAKSGRMCAETIVKNSQQGARMIDEADLMEHLREWDGNWLGTHVLFLLPSGKLT